MIFVIYPSFLSSYTDTKASAFVLKAAEYSLSHSSLSHLMIDMVCFPYFTIINNVATNVISVCASICGVNDQIQNVSVFF